MKRSFVAHSFDCATRISVSFLGENLVGTFRNCSSLLEFLTGIFVGLSREPATIDIIIFYKEVSAMDRNIFTFIVVRRGE